MVLHSVDYFWVPVVLVQCSVGKVTNRPLLLDCIASLGLISKVSCWSFSLSSCFPLLSKPAEIWSTVYLSALLEEWSNILLRRMLRHLQETEWFNGYFRRKGRTVGQTILPTCKEEVLNAEQRWVWIGHRTRGKCLLLHVVFKRASSSVIGHLC